MTDYLFKKFYKILAVIAVVSVIVPIVYFFFYWFLPKNYWPYVYIVSFVLFAVGYGMQAFYGAVTMSRHNSREGYDDESGYEAAVKPFQPLRAAGPIVVAAIIAIVSRIVIDRILYRAYLNGYVYTYDSQSLYPYIGMIAVFGLVFAGIVLWFYPPHRIISMRSMFTYFGIMGVVFAVSTVMSVPTTLMSVSLIVFFTCSFIVLNQTHIRKGVTGTLTAISNEGKYYNLKLMLVASFAVLFILIIFAAIFTGVGFLLKFIFIYVAVKLFNVSSSTEDGYYDSDDAHADFSDVMLENQPIGDKLLIVLCIAIFIVALVFFAFRGHALTKKILEKIKLWLRELFMFFMNAREYRSMSGASMSRQFANYMDETISLQDAAIRAYDPKTEKKRSYREFISYLNSLPTATHQIRYAYVTMLSVFRSLGYGVRRSETPRETKARVMARSANNDLTAVTDAIESVNYIEAEPAEEKCDEAVKAMCRIIRNNFDE